MHFDAFEPLRLLCQNGPDYGPGYGPGYGMFGSWHMMSPLGGGLFLVLFLVLVFIVLTRVTRRDHGPQESALDILKKRYAKGEISREELETMKRDIKD